MRTCRLLMLLPVLCFAACSTFQQRWNETPPSAPQISWLYGRWDGNWKSDKGHGEGNLKAVIVEGKAPKTFSATFKATYMKVLNSEYTVEMTDVAQQPEGRISFRGSKDLGMMAGGLYHYEGWADAENFSAKYTSKHDNGTFTLKRAR